MNPDIEQAKDQVRRRLLAIAGGLGGERGDREARIRTHLEGIVDRLECKVVMGFAPIGSEPDIGPLLEGWREAGREVCLPVVGPDPGMMEPVRLREGLATLGRDRLGVPTPEGPAVATERLDAVLVPGCGFDAGLTRLGRGGGYYDRFLARCPGVAAIGVCFESQVVQVLPTEAHDRGVDLLVTEQGVRSIAGFGGSGSHDG